MGSGFVAACSAPLGFDPVVRLFAARLPCLDSRGSPSVRPVDNRSANARMPAGLWLLLKVALFVRTRGSTGAGFPRLSLSFERDGHTLTAEGSDMIESVRIVLRAEDSC
ncbi:GRAM domain-containing protein 3-like isoform X1 [Anopheles sinensis]|uniref:GRAM domain-containing protein 3-like isoform X1 n=1 Tax=Anopheles sinensis TaxID=74873 RepID=A0A084W910_ANOSI|nr:GRAM domain-containing protein 3-like isoform X1 [Anopheles sinensis]